MIISMNGDHLVIGLNKEEQEHIASKQPLVVQPFSNSQNAITIFGAETDEEAARLLNTMSIPRDVDSRSIN